MTPRWRARITAAVGAGAAVALASLGMAGSPLPAGASSYVSISGSGSSWAAGALYQGGPDGRKNGIVGNYNPGRSAAGRARHTAQPGDLPRPGPPVPGGLG